MPCLLRNVPQTWASMDGWRTDIALTNLRGDFYEDVEFLLEDGYAIRIPMSEMRRALVDAKVRTNLMVGPFNVNPRSRAVNEVQVSMTIRQRPRH